MALVVPPSLPVPQCTGLMSTSMHVLAPVTGHPAKFYSRAMHAISSCSFGSLFTACSHTGFSAAARSLSATKTVTRPCIAFNYAVFCYWLMYTIDMEECQGVWEIEIVQTYPKEDLVVRRARH